MAATCRIIMQPTMTNVQPVAHGGIDASIGAKNREIRKQNPVTMADSPVRPPCAIPDPDSTNAVIGARPRSDPTDIKNASVLYATVLRGNSQVASLTTPQKRAME
jgi:hypothetical protein